MTASKRFVGGIAIHLQNAGEAGQLPGDLLGAAAIGKHIGDRRRRWAAPWAIIHRMRPELADTSAMSSGIEHRHRRLVAEQPRRSLDHPQLKLIKALEPPCRTLHPTGERRAVEMDALAGQDLHLAVQRQIPGELRDHHVSHQYRRYHSALNQTRQHLRLDHAVGATAAGVFGMNRAQYPQDRRDHVQYLAHILADPVQSALTARARCRVRLDHLLAARQVLGQRTDVAPRLLAWLPQPASSQADRRWLAQVV